MPLNSRDVLFILRARDEASRVLRSVGQGFGALEGDARRTAAATVAAGSGIMGIGTAIGATGAAGLAFLNDAREAAATYRQEVALTLTQVHGFQSSIEELAEVGRRVAQDVPAPFEQMQGTLFDIFSSMDVNVSEAETLLREFSRGAVAGQTDIQSAARASIAILNAFGLGAADINRVMDVQFELVRSGVGAYEEFASTIGRSIPSAARAGQTVEDLAGMLAFLTRNGLSTAMASASAARALDSLAHPVVIGRLHDMGIEVQDSAGNMRAMSDVAAELGQKLGPLTDAQKAEALQELFRGAGGTIQARRFWDLAIRHFDQLGDLTDRMVNSRGAMSEAYDIMFEQPQSQAQLFSNNLAILKTRFGDELLPAMQRVYEIGNRILQWFNNLSPSTRRTIILITAAVSAFLVLAGATLAIVGGFMMLSGTLALLGTSMGAVVLTSAGVLAAIAAIAAIAYVVYRNWDTIVRWWNRIWPHIKRVAETAWQGLQDAWDSVSDFFVDTWHVMQDVWDDVSSFFVDAWHEIMEVWQTAQDVWDGVMGFLIDTWHFLQAAWGEVVDTIRAGWNQIDELVYAAVEFFRVTFSELIQTLQFFGETASSILGPMFEAAATAFSITLSIIRIAVQTFLDYMSTLVPFFTLLWDAIRTIWDIQVNLIKGIMEGALIFIQGLWNAFRDHILPFIQAMWDLIKGIIVAALEIIQGIIQVALGLIRGDWESVWNGIKNIASGVWDGIKTIITTTIDAIKAIIGLGLDTVKLAWDLTWHGMQVGVETTLRIVQAVIQIAMWGIEAMIASVQRVVEFFGNLWDRVWNAAASVVERMVDIIKNVLETLKNAIDAALGPLDEILGKLGDVIGAVGGAVGSVGRIGGDIVGGIGNAIGLARGGLVPTGGQLALVGERGPELLRLPNSLAGSRIVPEGQVDTVMRQHAMAYASGQGATVTTGDINFNIYGATDPEAVGQAVHDALHEILMEARSS